MLELETYIDLGFKIPEHIQNRPSCLKLSKDSMFADDGGQKRLVDKYELVCPSNET